MISFVLSDFIVPTLAKKTLHLATIFAKVRWTSFVMKPGIIPCSACYEQVLGILVCNVALRWESKHYPTMWAGG